MHHRPSIARLAFERGAQAYVLKEAADSELVAALRAALAGRLYVNPNLGGHLLMAPADPVLTSRQLDIVRLVALGHTNQEVAQKLFLSVRTVEAHRHQIMAKLGLTTRAELVRYAIDRGIVDFGR